MPRSLAPAGLALGMFVLGAAAAQAQPLVAPDWLASHRGDSHVVVLDIRPAADQAQGHIPGAVQADYEKSGWRAKLPDGAAGALPPVDKIATVIGGFGVGDADKAVIVSDDFGAAARVYWTFKVLGHTDVSILDGGWKAWTAARLPATTEASAAPHPAVFTPHYNPAIRADMAAVERDLNSGGETLVDARPPAQWQGTAKSPVVARFGHLPHAVWIDQSDALTDGGTKLKPRTELAALFARAGDKPVTTYCNTGHLAATDWFVLSEVLHHPHTRLYDASLSEWTADPSRPVVK
jgi:thiosulfate/3-mercaptopyruvate sulfurtransferase